MAFLALAAGGALGALALMAILHVKHQVWRIVGHAFYAFPLGSCLMAVLGFLQLGPRSNSLCATSTALWVAAMSCMQSVPMVAIYTMQQQLTRPLFDARDATHVRRVTALQAAVLGANGIMLVATGLAAPSSLSSEITVTLAMEPFGGGGAMLPIAVCSAPAVWLCVLLGSGGGIPWAYAAWARFVV